MLKIRVTAPYIMLKVVDVINGGVTVREFYRGAVLPAEADSADVDRLLGKGMLAQEEFPDPEPAQAPEGPKTPAGSVKPAGNASRDDWVAYASGMGAPEEDTKPVDQGGLSRDDLRAKYGNGSGS
jgi:hypothetical protein